MTFTVDTHHVFSHAGGTVPFLAGRFAILDEMDVIPGAGQSAIAACQDWHRHVPDDVAWIRAASNNVADYPFVVA